MAVLICANNAITIKFFNSIRGGSYYEEKAIAAYDQKDYETADKYLRQANRLIKIKDTAFITHAMVYINTLKESNGLTVEQRQGLFDRAMDSLNKAEKLNPYRAQTYHLRANLLEMDIDVAKNTSENITQNIDSLYGHALKIDPRYLPASESYAKFLVKTGQELKARKIVVSSMIQKYRFNVSLTTTPYFEFAYNQLNTPDLAQLQQAMIEEKDCVTLANISCGDKTISRENLAKSYLQLME